MGELVTVLNAAGGAFVAFAAHMLIQSSVLIILLAALDLVLRRRVKAVVRYWIWLLVLAKLILPPSFSSPTGVAYWVGGKLPTLSGPIGPLVEESSIPSLPADGAAVPSEPRGPDSRPSVRYASEEPPIARPDNTPLYVTPHAPLVTWQALVLLGWAVIVAVMAVLLAQRALFIHRLVAQSREPGQETVELLRQCARRMGVRMDLAVKLSPLSASPSVCGLRRPVILIPEGMLSRLPVHELRSVLFHELAHIKRSDLWLNLLQAVLQVVYFYHPLLWAANVRIRRVREQAVDETVLAAMGDEAEDYPRTLLNVSRAAFGQPTLSLRLLGVVESERALMDRIRHMVSRPFPKNAKLGFTGLIFVLAVGAMLLPMAQGTPTRAQEPSPGRSPDSLTVASASGVTAEFLGVRPYSETDKPWWRADGTPATGVDFPEFKEFRTSLLTLNDPNARVRVLALRLAGPSLDDVTVSWSLTNSEGSHSTPYFPVYTVQQADEKEVLRPVQTIVARFVDEAATTDLKFGIAAGPWKDAAAGSEGRTTVYARDNITQKDVIYHPAQETDRSLIITATHLLSRDYDCRIVAEDENHRVFEPVRTNNSAGKCLSVLKVPRAQVKWFRLQARPYEWVEFKSVHLLPMAKAKSDASRAGETAASAAVPVVPDGSPGPGAGTPAAKAELESKPTTERATCGGTIVDEQGKPIPGVKVQVQWNDAPGHAMVDSCTTDARGRWQAAVPADVRNVKVFLTHADYLSDGSDRKDKPPMSRLRDGTSIMVMKRGLKLSGSVQDEEGKPIANALILPHDRYATAVGGAALEDATTARTGADGRFVLTGLPVGPRELTVTAPGYGPEGVPVEVTPEMGAIRVTMRPGGIFQGQVLDEDDKPVEDAGVTCCRWQTEQGHIISLMGRTDAQGRFTIADVPLKGTMEFSVNKREFLSHHHSIVLPAEFYHATLYRPPTLSGRVVDDETSEPITDFEVAQGILWPGDRAPFWREPQAVHSESGAFAVTVDRFVVRTAPPSCVVRIRAAGYVPEASSPVLVGEKPTPLVVRLHRGQPLTGFVRDPPDHPAPNARVAWIGPDHIAFIKDGQLQPQFMSSPEWVVRTDSQGRFELPPARTEGIILALHDTGYGWWRSADFTRDSAVHLTAWSRIAGTVRRADSDDHTMQLTARLVDPAADANNLPLRWFFDTTSHVDGQFAFEFVPSLRLAVGHVSEKKFFLADHVIPQPGQTCNLTIQVESPLPALRSLVGQALPALAEIGLASAASRLQNHPVLLCFFDMQQRPSRNGLQQLASQTRDLQAKGIVIAAVQVQKVDQAELDRWIKDNHVPFPVGMVPSDGERTRLAWGVRSLPWLILTDKDHVVRAEGFGIGGIRLASAEDNPSASAAGEQREKDVLGPEEERTREMFEQLREASRQNRALLKAGRIQAKVRDISFDEKGQKSREEEYEVHVIFQGERVRLDRTARVNNRVSTWKAVVTEDSFREYTAGETDAYLRAPTSTLMRRPYANCLPSKSPVFLYSFLDYPNEAAASQKITAQGDAESRGYVVEVIYKQHPRALERYYVDCAKGGSVVKLEIYNDFGEGHVLLRRDEAEMQSTPEGGWYLRRFASVGYRKDGTLRSREETAIVSFDFASKVSDREFTWEALGTPEKARIHDMRLGVSYPYSKPAGPLQRISETAGSPRSDIPEEARLLLQGMQEDKDAREQYRNLYALMNKLAPALEVTTWIGSKPLKLADLQDKVVVLDFWAIDCGPCIGDIGQLNKIHARSASEPVVVIGVHPPIDDISEVKNVMTKYNVEYPVCIDTPGGPPEYFGGRTFQKYAVRGIPRPFLIDIKGSVRAVSSPVNPAELEGLIKEHASGVTGTSPAEPDFLVGLKVAPERVSFPRVSRGQKVQKSIYILKPDEPAFTVKIEAAPQKPVTAELLKHQQASAFLYELRLLLDAASQSGDYASQVKLTTNDIHKPEVVIPVTARILSEGD